MSNSNEQIRLIDAIDLIVASMEQGYRKATARNIARRIVREQGLRLTQEEFEKLVEVALENVNKALDGGAA